MTLGKLIDLLGEAKDLHDDLQRCERDQPTFLGDFHNDDYERFEKSPPMKEWKKRKAALIIKQKKLYGVKIK